MTIKEAKEAFYNESPVVVKTVACCLQEIQYTKINAIIFSKKKDGSILTSLQLQDKCWNSVTTAMMEDVRSATAKECENSA